MGLLFLGSGTPTFWLGLLLFIKRESRTPTFKILVRTLEVQKLTGGDIIGEEIGGLNWSCNLPKYYRNTGIPVKNTGIPVKDTY